MKSITDEFLASLENITSLSEKVNGNDKKKIFEMIKDHSIEIQELYTKQNSHWAVETADLIVLCFELLVSEDIDINKKFEMCLPRFYKKLNERLKEH